MSRKLGRQLPDVLLQLLEANDLQDKWGQCIPLVTVDADGFPHVAILSFGEILGVSPHELRVGLYPNSTTTRNIRAHPQVTFPIVAGKVIYYVKGRATETASGSEAIVRFDVAVETVLVDDEPGTQITTGITFEMSIGKQAWLHLAQKTLACLGNAE